MFSEGLSLLMFFLTNVLFLGNNGKGERRGSQKSQQMILGAGRPMLGNEIRNTTVQ